MVVEVWDLGNSPELQFGAMPKKKRYCIVMMQYPLFSALRAGDPEPEVRNSFEPARDGIRPTKTSTWHITKFCHRSFTQNLYMKQSFISNTGFVPPSFRLGAFFFFNMPFSQKSGYNDGNIRILSGLRKHSSEINQFLCCSLSGQELISITLWFLSLPAAPLISLFQQLF